MTERITLHLTIPEIDVAVKALKHSGVGTQNSTKLYHVFHDYDLVNASAKALRNLSSAEKRSMSRSQAGEMSDIQREVSSKTAIDLLTDENNKLKTDLKMLFSAYNRLRESAQYAVDNLQE
jgi:hypothetical protein